jgi:hypothetical protein
MAVFFVLGRLLVICWRYNLVLVAWWFRVRFVWGRSWMHPLQRNGPKGQKICNFPHMFVGLVNFIGKMKFPIHLIEQDHWPRPPSFTPYFPFQKIMGGFSWRQRFLKVYTVHIQSIDLLPYRNVTFVPYTQKEIGGNFHGYFLFHYLNYYIYDLLYINSFTRPIQLGSFWFSWLEITGRNYWLLWLFFCKALCRLLLA